MNVLIRMAGLVALSVMPMTAAALDAPAGPVVLSISGAITETNNGEMADFDIDMLEALGTKDFKTSTLWTDGVNSYSGPTLLTVLEAVGAKSKSLRATALNDYSIEMNAGNDDFPGPIIATKMDDKAMSVRTKGPLWLIYPYDMNPKFQDEVVYSNSIWQLRNITVLGD